MSNLLLIKNIVKKYGDSIVLKDISLEINKQEIISLLGVNGAGKSTLSAILATIQAPTSGDIYYEEKSIYADVFLMRLKIGYCPQKPNLNNYLTLEQNLYWAGKCFGLDNETIQKNIIRLSRQLGLIKYLSSTELKLSGGYKQRFMIARSLMHQPEFLILDEPTVGMDPQIRRELWEVLKELRAGGMTILITTHYLDEAQELSDRCCILDRGVIKKIDTPKNLLVQSNTNSLEEFFIQFFNNQNERGSLL